MSWLRPPTGLHTTQILGKRPSYGRPWPAGARRVPARGHRPTIASHPRVEPDLIYLGTDRFKKIVGERNAQGPPDLAIEVLSPSTRRRDEIIKRRLYERTGVRLVGEKYLKAAELSLEDNARFTSPLLPDLGVPLKRVFEMP